MNAEEGMIHGLHLGTIGVFGDLVTFDSGAG